MDRKEYWNKNYVEYWKKVTNEAEQDNGIVSQVKKESGKDYKVPDISAISAIMDKIQFHTDCKILDFGCGFGRLYPWLRKKGTYYGIDISDAMISECKANFKEDAERFIVAEGESMPFSDDFFDVVVCSGVFDACYQESALAEMLRVTKINGSIMISGKNYNYFDDDAEAYIAEINARKKNHPNYFTDVRYMIKQLCVCSSIIDERYALRRGDYTQNKFVYIMPDIFYEYALVIQKNSKEIPVFDSFSSRYSAVFKNKESV